MGLGGLGNQYSYAIARHTSGRVAVGGTHIGPSVDGIAPPRRLALSILDEDDGSVLWTLAGEPPVGAIYGAAFRPDGTLVIAAGVGGGSLGDISLDAPLGSQNVLIAELSPDHEWSLLALARTASSSSTSIVDLELADDGSAVVAGSFVGTLWFDEITSRSAANPHTAYVARYGTDGSLDWAFSAIGGGEVQDVALGPDGSVTGVGGIYYTLEFDAETTFEQERSYDGFYFRLSSGGSPEWARAVRDWGSGSTRGVVVDDVGNAYIIGNAGYDVDLGDGVVRSTPSGSIYLAQVSPDGALGWSHLVGVTTGLNVYPSLCKAADGSILLTAGYDDSVGAPFSSTALPDNAHTTNDPLLAHVGLDGTVHWITTLPGAGSNEPSTCAATDDGLVATGLFRVDIGLGGLPTLNAVSGTDTWVAKLSPSTLAGP